DPGQLQPVILTGKLERAGWSVLTARVKSDDLEADNRFDRVIRIRDRVSVLVVDGNPARTDREAEKAASYYLLHALRPIPEHAWDDYHVRPRVVAPNEAEPALLSGVEACILLNVSLAPLERPGAESLAPEFLTGLAKFARDGGAVVFAVGDNVTATGYN